MRIFQIFIVLFTLGCLLLGNAASASMPCCKTQDGVIHMMDCHKSQDSKKSDHIKQCDCKSCVNFNVIKNSVSYETAAVSGVKHLVPNDRCISEIPAVIDTPPKHIS